MILLFTFDGDDNMKVKNIACFLIESVIIANSNIMVSCEDISKKYEHFKNRDFYDFLEDSNIVNIDEFDNITENYYEAKVADHNTDINGNIVITTHWEKLDDIDNVVCQAREFDYDYKVLSITGDKDNYEVNEMVIEDINHRPTGYDYIYEDDYLIVNGYSEVLINCGKVLRR